MEITTTMKIEATFIEKNNEAVNLPLGAVDENDLTQRIKTLIGADDVALQDVKQFVLEETR